ncbi:MAG: hypothetical protein ABSA39_02770 [Edaphobacter sp.]
MRQLHVHEDVWWRGAIEDHDFGPDEIGILGNAPADYDEPDLGHRGYVCPATATRPARPESNQCRYGGTSLDIDVT